MMNRAIEPQAEAHLLDLASVADQEAHRSWMTAHPDPISTDGSAHPGQPTIANLRKVPFLSPTCALDRPQFRSSGPKTLNWSPLATATKKERGKETSCNTILKKLAPLVSARSWVRLSII